MPGVSLPVAPGGAIYVFPRIEHRGMSGRELCLHLLEEHDLALVPGDVFGAGFEAHVRISFGGDMATQREAAARLADLLAR
jgi:aminotransferase